MRAWWLAIIGLIWLIQGLLGCATPPPPNPQPPTPPGGVVSCLRACEHLSNLGCQPGSDACFEVCRRIDSPDLNACLASASTCAQADDCDI